MFCAFEGPPKIVRLHGIGRPVQQGDDGFAGALARFDVHDEQRDAVRSVIDVEVTRVADSCGFVVPRMDYVGERDQLYRYAENRLRKEGEDAVRAYVTANNAESIDGLDGLDPLRRRRRARLRRAQAVATNVNCGCVGRRGPMRAISAWGDNARISPSSGGTCDRVAASKSHDPASPQPQLKFVPRPAPRRPSCARRRRRPTASPRGGPARPSTPGRRAGSSRRGRARWTGSIW